MANLLSPPTLIGLGLVILLTGGIILGLRLVGVPRDVALYRNLLSPLLTSSLFCRSHSRSVSKRYWA